MEQEKLCTLQQHSCLTVTQLQTCLCLLPFHTHKAMLERLVVGCDNIGIDVLDASPPIMTGHWLWELLHTALHTALQQFWEYRVRWTEATRLHMVPGTNTLVRGMLAEEVGNTAAQAKWDWFRVIQACLKWLGVRGVCTAEQLICTQDGSWLPRETWPPGHRPPASQYGQLLEALSRVATTTV